MKLRKALNKPHDSCFHCSICPFTWSDMLSSSLHFVIIQCISGIICPKSYHTYAFLRIGSTSMPYTCRFQCIRKVASKIRMEGLGVVMMTSLFLNYFAKILGGAIQPPPQPPTGILPALYHIFWSQDHNFLLLKTVLHNTQISRFTSQCIYMVLYYNEEVKRYGYKMSNPYTQNLLIRMFANVPECPDHQVTDRDPDRTQKRSYPFNTLYRVFFCPFGT